MGSVGRCNGCGRRNAPRCDRLPAGVLPRLAPDGRRIAFDFFEPDGDEQIATAPP